MLRRLRPDSARRPGRTVRRGFALLGCVLTLLLWALPARAEVKSARAVRTDTPPVIDGKLDDAVWQNARVIDDFTQTLPVEGDPPTERTEVRLLYDSEALYLGIRMYDSEPDKLIATQMTYDETQVADDRINLLFDTFDDQRNGYFFQINPVGARSEALIENNERFRREWNTIWYARASIDDQGWVAEFAIPYQSINFNPDSTTWGMEIERYIRRRNENGRWANPSKNRTIMNVAGIGKLEGLEGLEGTGIDVKPTFSLGYQRIRDEVWGQGERDWDAKGRLAGDVFMKPIPQLTAALTLNTDFTEAGVDLRQTNLTRFALFFPETRDFFLQDNGIFQFGGLEEENGIPFFSRRVGRIEDELVDLEVGLKVTGRQGPLNFGALQVRTEETSDLDWSNLSVVRVQANVMEESQLGVIMTSGDPKHDVDNAVYGADFRYRNSAFRGSNILTGDLWVQKSQTSGKHGRDHALGAQIAYPNDRINFELGYREFGENYTPLLGFANRVDISHYNGSYRYRVRPKKSYLRTIDTAIEGYVIANRHDQTDSSKLTLRPIELANNDGDVLKFHYIFQWEHVDQGFEVVRTWIPKDTYRFDGWFASLETTTARPVKGKLAYTYGEWYTGHLYILTALVELRPSPHFFASLEWEQKDGRMRKEVDALGNPVLDDDGNPYDDKFTARIVRANIDVNFTPDISWTNLIQYDNVSDTVGINSRLRWEIEPGNELFFVFNQGYDVDNSSVKPRTSQAIGKVRWTFRF